MNTPADKANLISQAKGIMDQTDEFLTGDHSDVPEEEYIEMQKRVMHQQSMAMAALLKAMGFKEKEQLMQSEDADVEDIKRRAGLSEHYGKPNRKQAHDFYIMKQVNQLATQFMQDERSDPEIAARMLISYAKQLGKG